MASWHMDFILYTDPEKTRSNILKKINLCLESLKCMTLEAGHAVRASSSSRDRENRCTWAVGRGEQEDLEALVDGIFEVYIYI